MLLQIFRNFRISSEGKALMSVEVVKSNLSAIKGCIRRLAAGRPITLVAVSKYQPKESISACYESGHICFGENYVQELEEKSQALKEDCPDIRWHYIGQVQSNKINKISSITNLDCVQTLESEKHCSLFEQQFAKRNKRLKVFIQVNTSEEDQKGGKSKGESLQLAEFILKSCPHLDFRGFMTIGSVENSGKVPNPDFQVLRSVREEFAKKPSSHLIPREFLINIVLHSLLFVSFNTNEVQLDGPKSKKRVINGSLQNGKEVSSVELSMGMSSDFEEAIKEGSTTVRVGSSIFGERIYNKS